VSRQWRIGFLTDTGGLSSFTIVTACVMAEVVCAHGCLALIFIQLRVGMLGGSTKVSFTTRTIESSGSLQTPMGRRGTLVWRRHQACRDSLAGLVDPVLLVRQAVLEKAAGLLMTSNCILKPNPRSTADAPKSGAPLNTNVGRSGE
jgi:hypothetical protein